MKKETSNSLEHSALMGALLLDAGKISTSNAERIIHLQKQKGMKFGDAAKALGLIDDEDIQKALSFQFDFPYMTPSDRNLSPELVAAYQPFSTQVEALRAVRGQLMLRWFIDVHKTLALISPDRNEGRSYIASNLAIVFSQLGERTLLIDADLRKPRQHELFKLQTQYGLSDILAGRSDLNVFSKVPGFRDLSVLAAGTLAPNPNELISRGLKGLLQALKSQFEVILIDTPSVKQGVDAEIIASNCGGALLIARQHKTKLDDLHGLKESLQDTGSQCIGVIINSF